MTYPKNFALILDIDGVIRDVSGSYRRALADTVEHFTQLQYRPTSQEIDQLKQEGLWNNDWEAAQELIRRFTGTQGDYAQIVTFFQARYRGQHWDGYIAQEPLLVTPAFFAALTDQGIGWGFFSGATRASATFVLHRLGLNNPVLVAMEDAPGKPDPTGLLAVAVELGATTVVYAGDTAADMLTVLAARQRDASRRFVAIGVLPPHALGNPGYRQALLDKGADRVVDCLTELTPEVLATLA